MPMQAVLYQVFSTALAAFTISILLSPALAAQGNATRGQRVFAPCAACHSLEPNRNMTGPSLAELRKAGSLASFPRYSSALGASGILYGPQSRCTRRLTLQ
jgi:cytochrome c